MRFARHFLWLLPVMIALLAVGVLTVQGILRHYLGSEEFRAMVSAKASAALQVSGEFLPLRWTGFSVYSDAFEATEATEEMTNGRGPVARVAARNVRARWDWRAVFSGLWKLDGVQIASLDLTLQPRTVLQGAEQAEAEKFLSHEEEASWPAWMPRRFATGRIEVESLQVRYEQVTLRGGRAELEEENGSWHLTITGGTLEWPGMPHGEVKILRARARDGGFYLTEARVLVSGGGNVDISGEIPPGGESYAFLVNWSKVPASAVLPQTAARHLEGFVAGEMRVTGGKGVAPSPLLAGDFSLSEGQVRGLTVLSALSTFTGSPRFERVPVHRFSGDFTHQGMAWNFENLLMESKGLVQVEGSLHIGAGQALDGHLEVGLTPQTLQWIPGSRERVFTDSRDGYRWAPVRVTGTLSSPKENLSARLLRATGEQVFESGRQTVQDAAGQAVEGVRGVIDVLRPLLE